jgi:cysteine desulfurase
VAGIVGMARRLELAQGDPAARDAESARLAGLRDRLLAGVRDIPGVEPSGHPVERLPHSASWLIDAVEGGDLVAALDLDGVEGSTGSACTSGAAEPSHVLLAMGFAAQRAHGALRLTARPPDDTGRRGPRQLMRCVRRSGGCGPGVAAPNPVASA